MADHSSLTGTLARFGKVGLQLGGFAAQAGAARLGGRDFADPKNAAELRRALGSLKGPVMKIAQILSTIPDALPPQFAAELAQLQANAPPMGPGFLRRRMGAELGPDWRNRFGTFDDTAVAAASLGQVHRATLPGGAPVAVKLQYPDMSSAVEADLKQLDMLFGALRMVDKSIDPSEIREELAARLREELDYAREARHLSLYRAMLADNPHAHVPGVHPDLSTTRLLTMDWLDGAPLMSFKGADQATRDTIAERLFNAWYAPFYRYGIIHGDPHMGNYSVRPDLGINLLDFGCVRIFPPRFIGGVNRLYHAIEANDRDAAVHAFELWGFRDLSREIIETLLIWAEFLYGPLLDDRVRPIADNIAPGEYGRATAAKVHARLRTLGTVTVPAEFVFMDRAAIGLGGVFIHMDARLNWHRLFRGLMDDFDEAEVATRQSRALHDAGLSAEGADGKSAATL
ncbi:ABC1 kinase family protein [Sandaracinobacteroides saxicola]|uniref:AarF/ABC1/UbiB kinase family protein n=1 Tax=Sandaracinobacteroides saxicola TaxID=2759707 RepID=A0A7G5IF91_9SPHN|nr:AarF/ABC1/UbiB kinase family protein [Sandaracinobacteroides saxicola]QMW22033.1 AarF/ABC1/UbiB kinase family protein [Sandaracinobacteroides saxicola]